MTRPDFLYDDHQAVVYVDGPPHDFPERQNRDKAQNSSMEDAGFQVIRFHHAESWDDVVKRFPSVFGSPGMTFTVGSLVRARGREWVVLPESSEEMTMLRPLGGGDMEVTGILRRS